MKKRWVSLLIYIGIAALLVAGVVLIVMDNVRMPQAYEPPPTPIPTAKPTPAATVAPTAAPTPTPLPQLADPIAIYFTEHELSAPIIPVGRTEEGAMDAPKTAHEGGWYQDGASPGEAGNAIIDGHVRWKGKLGTFSVLREMAVGEEIVIEYADGTFKYFTAQSVDIHRLDAFPPDIMKLDIGGEPRMTLITCLGDYNRSLGTSESRVVVICKEKE